MRSTFLFRSGLTAILLASTCPGSGSKAFANPVGGEITKGAGTITSQDNVMNIQQQSHRLDIDWRDFSIGANETVNFHQPDTSALAINRVIGGVPSQLNGALNANGRVFVINDSGITIGAGAQINTGAFLATTAKITEDGGDQFTFSDQHFASVINHGDITVSPGGFAVLAAPYVENTGRISADRGQVELASGTQYTLDLRGDGLINFTVDGKTPLASIPEGQRPGITHTGTIEARSGTVILSAAQVSDVIAGVINLDGVVDATALGTNDKGGTILIASQEHIDMQDQSVLDASARQNGDGGTVHVIADGAAVAREGSIMRARGGVESGSGGQMEFSGHDRLFVLGGTFDTFAAHGEQGDMLFDPTDVTIGALTDGFPVLAGIDSFLDPNLGNNIISAATLGASLTDVTIQATNNVTFNSDVNFLNIGGLLFDHLTVQAGGTIAINSNITGVGDFNVTMIADDAASPIGGANGSGALTMADGATINVGGGTISLSAAQDITVGRLLSTNAGAAAIQLTSSAGAVVDGGDAGGVNIQNASGGLTVSAATGFGTAGAIETQLGSVNINAGNGALRLTESDGLTITSLANNTAQDFALSLGDNLTLGTSYNRTGTAALSIDLTGANRLLTVNTAQSTVSGNLSLTSTGNVVFGASGDLTSISGLINVASSGGVLTMNDGTLFNAGSGRIALSAAGDITLGGLLTTNADAGGNAITLTSTTGGIVDGGNTLTDIIAQSGTLTVNAATGFGVGNAIETGLGTASITSTAGAITLAETDGITLTGLSTGNADAVTVTAGGDTALNAALNKTSGSVSVTVNGGGDLAVNNTIATTTGLVTLTAADDLNFAAGGDITTTSGNIIVIADNDSSGAGALTMNAGTLFNAGSGRLALNAAGDITLGGLLTTNADAGGNAVTLTSSAGAVVDGGDSFANISAQNGTLAVNAATGFGAAGAIETSLGTADIASVSGAIHLAETDGITLSTLATANGSNVTVTAGGDTLLNATLNKTSGSVSITATGSGDLTVNAPITTTSGTVTLATADDLTLNNPIITGTGTVTLSAADDLGFAVNGDITAASGNIIVTADSDLSGAGVLAMNAGTLFNSGSGRLALSAAGDITLGGLLTTNADAGGDAVTLTSTAGGIVDGGDTFANISAQNGTLVVNAATGFGAAGAVETSLGTANITSTSGAINLAETDGVTLTGLSTDNADAVAVTTGGNTTLNAVLNKTSGNVSVTVGGNGDLAVTNAIATTTGLVTLSAADDIDFAAGGDITSASGDITITADNDASGAGTLTMNAGTLFNAGSGNIALSAAGDITLGGILTTNADVGGNAVILTSTAGSIVDGGDTFANISAQNGTLAVNAATGFGAGGAIETSLGAANITSTSGAIDLVESDAITLAVLSTGAGDNVTVTAGGDVALNATLNKTTGSVSITTTGSGDLIVGAPLTTTSGMVTLTAADDLTLNNPIITGTGTVTLSSADDIGFAANGDITSASGDIFVTADSDSGGGGALTMNAGTLFNAGSGMIELNAADDITLGGLLTTNADAGGDAVTLTSTAGGIVDGGDTFANISAQNGTLTVNAATGFGAGGAIETSLDTANITLTSGAINLNETDGITLAGLTTGNASDIAVTTGGDTTVSATINKTSGNVSITADGGDLAFNAPATTTTGNVTLVADDDVIFTAGGDITTTSGDITVTADNDSSGSGALTMNAGTLFNAGSGNIVLDAAGNITLGGLLTTNADAGGNAITLTSTTGGIVDGGDTFANISAQNGTLTVNAATGFGAAGAVETNVAIADIASVSGAINMNEANGITLTGLDTDDASNITVTTGGDTVVDTTISQTSGNIAITAGNNGDLAINDALATTTGAIALAAGGEVELGATGDLTSGSGNISVEADGGALIMAGGTEINSGTGSVALVADGDITLAEVTSANAGNNAVIIDSGGDILSGGAVVDVTAVNGTVRFTGQTIGDSGNSVVVSADTVVFTTDGIVYLESGTGNTIDFGTSTSGNGDVNLTIASYVPVSGDGYSQDLLSKIDSGSGIISVNGTSLGTGAVASAVTTPDAAKALIGGRVAGASIYTNSGRGGCSHGSEGGDQGDCRKVSEEKITGVFCSGQSCFVKTESGRVLIIPSLQVTQAFRNQKSFPFIGDVLKTASSSGI